MPTMREMMLKSIGGWWGLVDSAVPAAAFVIANAIGGFAAAMWTGIAVGVTIFIFRLLRKESPQQAISGFFGLAICIVIAKFTGEARGFFLLGIWRSALMAAIAVVSVVVGRPLVGVIWEFISPSHPAVDGKPTSRWRANKALMRTYRWTTLMWGTSYAVRFFLERYLYDQNDTGLLGAVRIIVGYPLLIGLAAVSFLAVTRTRKRITADQA